MPRPAMWAAGLRLSLTRAIAHSHRHDSERDATLLLLIELAAGKQKEWADYLDAVAFGLEALGWRSHTGAQLEPEPSTDCSSTPGKSSSTWASSRTTSGSKQTPSKRRGRHSPAQHFVRSRVR